MSPAEVIEVAKIFVLAVAVLNGVIDLARMARWLVHKIAPVLLRALKKEPSGGTDGSSNTDDTAHS